MTVSVTPHFMPFTTFEPFHHALRAQLRQDVEVLFTYANLPNPLNEACRYVMTAHGKMVRPLLVASAFASVNISTEDNTRYDMCRRAALAVELLHTYSLVHDDLPCMDDDALRRGQPTAHIVFDEATALLAGDVLQTLAFEVLSADMPTFAPANATLTSQLLAIFAPRARRMVAGQMLDLNAEARSSILQSELEAIHRDKTGALIEAAVLMGAICADASALQQQALQTFAQHIGLAFQVQDDVLDVTTSTDTLGKSAGSDEKLDKSTYVKLMGVDSAQHYAQSLFTDGKSAIINTHHFSSSSHHALLALTDWLWARHK